MLRGFRQPYKKLFDGDVFTTVRLIQNMQGNIGFVGYKPGREDKIGLYPRTDGYSRLGTAQVVAGRLYTSIDSFAKYCTEEFAQYDAELTKDDFIKSLTIQAKRRRLEDPWVLIYTYLWTGKEDGWYEAKEGMQ
ncbi:MAG: hypothetical protein ACXADO_00795 [Candidatus Thorarchaeota archaeon]|jgi:hypothetical protein